MIITETNCETGETFDREMTADEIIAAEHIAADKAANEASDLAFKQAKESALAKFQALGLTEEEALALLG